MRRTSRRAVLTGIAGFAGCGSPGAGVGGTTSSAGTTSDGDGDGVDNGDDDSRGPVPDRVEAELVAGGFVSPVSVVVPPGADGRAYVADQAGVVYVLADGERSTFLDLRDRIVDVSGYSERGLLGLAFHPDFPDDDRVFVRYSAPRRAGTPSGYSHTFVLAAFSATPDRADADSERAVLELPQPQANHNAGAVAFGPDGYCYVATGDGGAGGDQGRGHVADWYDDVAGGNGQDVTENLLGSVLRIDVDAGGPGEYGVPGDNPLVGRDGLDEQYAWGFRNPWRFSFDSGGGGVAAATGTAPGDDPDDATLYVADVGQNRYEEVNAVEAGGNYGWNVREGRHCYAATDCPSRAPGGDPLRDPVVEYPHDGDPVGGVAVVGGYVYRGRALDGLAGRYVFADWQAGGRLFVATPDDETPWPTTTTTAPDLGRYVLGFGRDTAGELLICSSQRGGVAGSTGAVHRLTGTG